MRSCKPVGLLALVLPVAAWAQDAVQTTPASFLDKFLSPAGVAVLLSTVLGILGGIAFFTQKRKRLVALGTYYAFHIAEDVGNEIEGTDKFDKMATALKSVDAWMVANGWRPLKPGEMEAAKLQLQAIHGAEVAKVKVVEAGASALAAANPPTP